jgi:hypothetical protein
MSDEQVYSVLVNYTAESEARAQEIRRDLIDHLVNFAVGEIAVVMPIEKVWTLIVEEDDESLG